MGNWFKDHWITIKNIIELFIILALIPFYIHDVLIYNTNIEKCYSQFGFKGNITSNITNQFIAFKILNATK